MMLSQSYLARLEYYTQEEQNKLFISTAKCAIFHGENQLHIQWDDDDVFVLHQHA